MRSIIIAVFCVAAVVALPFDVIEDEEGQQYYAVPTHRIRRQTNWGVSNTGVGLSHTGTLHDGNIHRFDGTASAQKHFGTPGILPNQVGGRVDYQHKPSGSGAFVSADHLRGMGTDVNAGAKLNLHQSKNWDVGVSGQYGRHFGGPWGTGKPNYGAFLNANGRF